MNQQRRGSGQTALVTGASMGIGVELAECFAEDGYDLIRKVRALQAPRVASIPAGAVTAFARDEDRQAALAAGFQLHVAKPVDAMALVSAVARLGQMRAA